ncbi:MAG: hypothetical protein GY915_04560 [bacterium]|nr:hypothetical protein [bacterium]
MSKKITMALPPSKREAIKEPSPEMASKIDMWVTGNKTNSTPTDTKKINKRLSVDLDAELLKSLKSLCVSEGITISKKVESLVLFALKNPGKP